MPNPIYKYGVGIVYTSLIEENLLELFETELKELIRFNQDSFKLSYNDIILTYTDSVCLKKFTKIF